MNPSLTEFRGQYQELLLNFLWRQWTALGMPGHERGDDPWVIDPEALLLFTCTLGRHDARLFDEMINWLQTNGRFINILRLKRILRTEKFAGSHVLAAVAGVMSKGTDVLKWKQLAESPKRTPSSEHLFFAKDGKALPVAGELDQHFAGCGLKRSPLRLRGSQRFWPAERPNLFLQLRALFGINARCEIILYLMTHEASHSSEIARDVYYFDRAVQNTLVDMNCSGAVQSRSLGRKKYYWIRVEQWASMLNRGRELPRWITWPPLFSAVERIWLKLNDPQLLTLDPLLQSSEVRQLMVEVRPSLERAGSDKALSDHRQYLGESYLPLFLSDITNLLG